MTPTTSNTDARGYRRLRYRWIVVVLLFWWIVLTIFTLLFPTAAPFIALTAIFAGWQQGVLSERNDWDDWFRKHARKGVER